MKKDTNKTNVIFLVHQGNALYPEPEVFAYFPDEPFNDSPGLNTCYAHIGQHGACHVDYAMESKHASSDEFKDLCRELQYIGYNLQIQDKYGNNLNNL